MEIGRWDMRASHREMCLRDMENGRRDTRASHREEEPGVVSEGAQLEVRGTSEVDPEMGELGAIELKAKHLAGVDMLVGKDGCGKFFSVGDLHPHIGIPMSEGADVIGDIIVCPMHGSSFRVMTGELIDWCLFAAHHRSCDGLCCEEEELGDLRCV